MTPPKKSAVWTVWCVVMALYLGMNAYNVLKQQTSTDTTTLLLGWGIIMPILTNFVWWVIAFRMRSYFRNWWIWGIATTPVVGVAGFLTMMMLSKM